MSSQVQVDSLPKCDFCEKSAQFDAATVLGPWGNMCLQHFHQYGIGLGTGLGQKLILKKGARERSTFIAPGGSV